MMKTNAHPLNVCKTVASNQRNGYLYAYPIQRIDVVDEPTKRWEVEMKERMGICSIFWGEQKRMVNKMKTTQHHVSPDSDLRHNVILSSFLMESISYISCLSTPQF